MSDDVWDEVESSVEEKVPRDRWGRPLVVPPTGGKPTAYTRVTTYAGAIEDYYTLGLWEQRMVAIGLSKRPDLVLSVAAHENDKEELNALAEAAKEAAAASAKATIGTALHKLAERYDRGEEFFEARVPDSYRPDVIAYAEAMKPLKIHGIEEFVVIDALKVAGTFDRIVEYDGTRYVADIKTGGIEYGVTKMAIQLALYAHGQRYLPDTGERSEIEVSRNAGIIIHLPAGQGRCDLYWINLKAGMEAVDLCDQVRGWRKRKDLLAAATFGPAMLAPPDPNPLAGTPYEGVTATVDTIAEPEYKVGDQVTVGGITFTKIGDDPFDQAVATVTAIFPETTVLTLTDQINAAASFAELETVWFEHRTEWSDEHTTLATARKKHLHQRSIRNTTSV